MAFIKVVRIQCSIRVLNYDCSGLFISVIFVVVTRGKFSSAQNSKFFNCVETASWDRQKLRGKSRMFKRASRKILLWIWRATG